MKNIRNPIEQAGKLVLIVITTAFFCLLIKSHFQVINNPEPLDYYEGTMLAMTGKIANGESIYTLENQPVFNYVYTPLYNYLSAPFTKYFGNTFQTLRSVSAFFIFLSTGLFFYVTWRASKSFIASLVIATSCYAGFIYYATVVASTNSTGLFFFLCTVFIPWLFRFSLASLIFSAVCGVLAFFSKQYFIIGLAYVSIALFISHSIKKSVLFALLSFLLLVFSVAIFQVNQPYFLDNTFFGVNASAKIGAAFKHVLTQTKIFAVLYAAVIIPTALHLVFKLRHIEFKKIPEKLAAFWGCIQFSNLSKPFLTFRVNYFFLCFLLSTLVIVLLLGKHQGNYMTYLIQLMGPFLLISSILYLLNNRLLYSLGVPFIAVFYYQFYNFLPNDFSYDKGNWETVYSVMEPHDDLFVSPMLTHELIRTGKNIRHAGHTFYFPLAAYKPSIFQHSDPDHRVEYLWNQYLTDLYKAIETQKIDLIIVNIWDIHGIFGAHPPPDNDLTSRSVFEGTHPPNSELTGREFLEKYYEVTRKVRLSMTDRQGGGTYKLMIYEPKKVAE